MKPNRGDVGGSKEISPQPTPVEKGELGLDKQSERASINETSPGQQPAAPSLPAAPIVIPDANPINLPTTPQGSSSSTVQSTVKDNDRIERQWVDKAKNIVERNKDDPFKQKNEMSKVKAEYIKYRFDKTIKTDTRAA